MPYETFGILVTEFRASKSVHEIVKLIKALGILAGMGHGGCGIDVVVGWQTYVCMPEKTSK